ncbi:MAG: DUF1294 domain-containing protein [Clostridia bacterium]|nr:DUF1294 domain-containing protein [Clostridia bacterium]
MALKIYLVFLAVMSVIAFFVYAADKSKAKKKAWRIPEKILLSLSFFGGAFGGYLAMQLARHKTKKWYFHLINWLGLIWQVCLLVYLYKHPNILL